MSIAELSRRLQVELSVIQELIAEKSRLTVDLAYRLYLYFGTSARYWLNLQRDYDLALYPNKETLQKQIQPYP
jgi:addiction module HigA family antidote